MSKSFIEIVNISKTYKTKGKPDVVALQGVSFEIFRGETLGLLGVNGAGKSTLSSILCTLHPPSSGEIIWEGESIHKKLTAFRNILGFCPQKPNLDSYLNLGEALEFAGRCYGMRGSEAKMRACEVMELLKLSRYSKMMPRQLSGGYKQRFTIARTLMHRPKLIVLDEPTVGLDPHVRRELWEIIRFLKSEGVTVLLTTHYLDEAEALSDRVCFIHNGEVKIIDTPQNLLEKYKKQKLEDVFLDFVDEREVEIFTKREEEGNDR